MTNITFELPETQEKSEAVKAVDSKFALDFDRKMTEFFESETAKILNNYEIFYETVTGRPIKVYKPYNPKDSIFSGESCS